MGRLAPHKYVFRKKPKPPRPPARVPTPLPLADVRIRPQPRFLDEMIIKQGGQHVDTDTSLPENRDGDDAA